METRTDTPALAYARATTTARCARMGDCEACQVRNCDFRARLESYSAGYEAALKAVPAERRGGAEKKAWLGKLPREEAMKMARELLEAVGVFPLRGQEPWGEAEMPSLLLSLIETASALLEAITDTEDRHEA